MFKPLDKVKVNIPGSSFHEKQGYIKEIDLSKNMVKVKLDTHVSTNWFLSHQLVLQEEKIMPRKCTCDFVKVILVKGCQCGGC